MNKETKKSIVKIITTALLTALILFVLIYLVSIYFDTHKFVWNWPVKVTMPLVIKKRNTVIINPMVKEVKAQELKKIRTFNNDIEKEIYAVFGEEHYDKAMLLLTCENTALNPKATNYNKNENGVVLSKDYGVFQINDHWQGVTNVNFLFDPAINIRMAYNIYKNSDFTFKMWSCGKRLSI